MAAAPHQGRWKGTAIRVEHRLLGPRARMRASVSVLVAALVIAALPASARAQMTGQVQAFGDRATPVVLTDTSGGRPINAEECASIAIPVLLRNIPSTAGTPSSATTHIDVWHASTSATCQNVEMRVSMSGGMPVCTHALAVAIDNRGEQTVSIPASAVFDCAAASVQSRRVFLFASPGDTNISVTYQSGQWFQLDVTYDPVAPEAPVLDGPIAAGDTSITVTFDAPSGPVYGATLYVDPAGCPGGMPGSSLLTAGARPPASGVRTVEEVGASPTAIAVSGADIGLDYGEYAAVAATFTDRARNESVLSNVVCVQRVRVRGFWDEFCAERMLDDESCRARYGGCAVTPGTTSAPAASALVLLLAVAAIVRGARRVRSHPRRDR